MNTPVNFELAKLLKEKGFDSYRTSQYVQLSNDNWKLLTNQEYQDLDCEIGIGGNIRISAPTIAEVVMWLYDKHGIWIEVVKPVRQKLFRFNVDNKDDINEFTSVVCFKSPTEAYEAAVFYVLSHLI